MIPGRWSVLALLFAVRATMGFQYQSVAAVAPLIARDMGLTLADIGLHRSQLHGTVERLFESVELDAAPSSVQPLARRMGTGLSAAQQWLHRV